MLSFFRGGSIGYANVIFGGRICSVKSVSFEMSVDFGKIADFGLIACFGMIADFEKIADFETVVDPADFVRLIVELEAG